MQHRPQLGRQHRLAEDKQPLGKRAGTGVERELAAPDELERGGQTLRRGLGNAVPLGDPVTDRPEQLRLPGAGRIELGAVRSHVPVREPLEQHRGTVHGVAVEQLGDGCRSAGQRAAVGTGEQTPVERGVRVRDQLENGPDEPVDLPGIYLVRVTALVLAVGVEHAPAQRPRRGELDVGGHAVARRPRAKPLRELLLQPVAHAQVGDRDPVGRERVHGTRGEAVDQQVEEIFGTVGDRDTQHGREPTEGVRHEMSDDRRVR